MNHHDWNNYVWENESFDIFHSENNEHKAHTEQSRERGKWKNSVVHSRGMQKTRDRFQLNIIISNENEK